MTISRRKGKCRMKKKVGNYIPLILGIVVVICVLGLRVMGAFSEGEEETFTASTLIKTVDIAELSTAKFTYNGIAPVYDESGKIKCQIRYKAIVKAGINMKDIDFTEIDEDKKIVKPKLPQIKLTANIIDENEFSYIPENTKIEIKDALQVCEEDVEIEASNSTKLMESAEESLKNIVEALILPVVEPEGYTIEWE